MKEYTVITNLETYDDPVLYDKENDGYEEDITFLAKRAARAKGPIVDLACGTGRVTIPLAKHGHRLIGVDLHNGMLAEAERKSSASKLDIEWLEQDCCELDLNIKSPLIYMVGNSFQHFLTNEAQDAFLQSVQKHLTAEGIFIFGTRYPSEEELSDTSEEFWRSYEDPEDGLRVDMFNTCTYHPLEQIQYNTTIRRKKDDAGTIIDERRADIQLRFVYPKEMERLLHYNGYEIVNSYGDWQENPLTNRSSQMIYVCRKTK
ncbi:class I SAM-dependent methyltransferase [Pseudalkalibacillus sp. SCS-8]|uniref:class I SAM-dependent DNA methyltransferase n=1 Tax=Pseudalkalibacillus nanhaiensis TaxID=3115291 RepID=UPI0032DAB3B2